MQFESVWQLCVDVTSIHQLMYDNARNHMQPVSTCSPLLFDSLLLDVTWCYQLLSSNVCNIMQPVRLYSWLH